MALPLEAQKVADRDSPEVRREVLDQVKAELWRRGNLKRLCLPNAQTQMYERAHDQVRRFPGQPEPMVFLCHRQLGKSHMSVLLCIERAIRQPGARIMFGMDTVENAMEIWSEKVSNVYRDMPPQISYWTRKNFVFIRDKRWPKGVVSKIALRGLDYNRGDGMRGGNCDMVVLDEVRNIHFLQHVVRNVINPMWRGAKDPLFLMLTTPPDNDDHDFLRYYNRAQQSGSLVVVPASKNPDFTSDDERMLLAEYGSKEDVGWQRELECRMIPNTDRLIIPEWGASDGQYFVEEVPRPRNYQGQVTLDLGWVDHTGAVLTLYDFENRRLCALDEIFLNRTPIDDLVEVLVEKIEACFPENIRRDLIIRSDARGHELHELNRALREYGYHTLEIGDKYDRAGSINALRSGITSGRVLVQQNCLMLDRTLKNAVWDKRRKDFERSKTIGHADLLAALNYAYRTTNWDSNPVPMSVPRNISPTNAYIPDHSRTSDEAALLAALGKK